MVVQDQDRVHPAKGLLVEWDQDPEAWGQAPEAWDQDPEVWGQDPEAWGQDQEWALDMGHLDRDTQDLQWEW